MCLIKDSSKRPQVKMYIHNVGAENASLVNDQVKSLCLWRQALLG